MLLLLYEYLFVNIEITNQMVDDLYSSFILRTTTSLPLFHLPPPPPPSSSPFDLYHFLDNYFLFDAWTDIHENDFDIG